MSQEAFDEYTSFDPGEKAMSLSWSTDPEEASYNCVRSGALNATTSGVGTQTVPATGNPEDRNYVMPAVFNYEATETCDGYYDAFLTPEATSVTRCTFSAQATANIQNFVPEAGQGAPQHIKITYREGASPGAHTWGLGFAFNPGIDHTVTLEDSCDQLAVAGRPIQGGIALYTGGVSGPARSSLVAGSSMIDGQIPAGSGIAPTSWTFSYVGPEVTAAPTIGIASAGQLGAPVNATTRWSEPLNNGSSPVTAYKVQAQKLNASGAVVARVTKSAGASARSLVVKLTKGRYKFRVAAVNAKGQSAWSSNSSIVRAR